MDCKKCQTAPKTLLENYTDNATVTTKYTAIHSPSISNYLCHNYSTA